MGEYGFWLTAGAARDAWYAAVSDCCFFFCRGFHQNNQAKRMSMIKPPTAAPIAIPAIAPVPKPSLSLASTAEVLEAVAEAVSEAVDEVVLSPSRG
jgi:hypothetical protein